MKNLFWIFFLLFHYFRRSRNGGSDGTDSKIRKLIFQATLELSNSDIQKYEFSPAFRIPFIRKLPRVANGNEKKIHCKIQEFFHAYASAFE